MIVLAELLNGKCYSLQLHELILEPGLAGPVTKPFVVSDKFLNFYKGEESTVGLGDPKYQVEMLEVTITWLLEDLIWTRVVPPRWMNLL